ncbi:MAG: threonylcarbamoyl-AMP synthase [Omnitrophica bacterium RBG_13_46_9]|nr:MAG: threonylcarbamoyl-AMP synthase [Omnitrophica bacterium RBG_13_46_9]
MAKTEILRVDPHSPDERAVEFAATLLRDGGLVAFPTETVYGIGANFLDEKAMVRLREIKKRPADKPFTIHISSLDMVIKMGCEISPLADRLIKEFWPGPLTLILRSKKGSLGFRMPKNNIAKDLISKSGVPIVAPSANISGQKPAIEADEVFRNLGGEIDLILDSGRTEFGKESTVVDTTIFPYRILRKGAISESEIDEVWGKVK